MKARVPWFRRYASGLVPLVFAGCASAPINDSTRPVLTLQATFADAWHSSIEVLGAERLLERCVLGAIGATIAESDCPEVWGDGRQEPTGLLGTEWTEVDPSGLRCGAADVFSGHQAQFEVTVSGESSLLTTVRVIGTYRARAAASEAGVWTACASNGEPERGIRSRIVQSVEARQP